jgi:propanol-preferring alcohol dehydrogenase
LCESAVFHGYTRDGGFATHLIADARFCLRLPECYGDEEAAPLLCAGLIGYRSLHKAGQAGTIGIYGFGAAAHLITQLADAEGRKIYAFTRPGDERSQTFAREVGAAWAGSTQDAPPEPLDAAIIFAPAGDLVPVALRAVRPGGCVVCGGIHMSDIPGFPYTSLWQERSLTSVANMTRQDGAAFMAAARTVRLRVSTTSYPLTEANRALADLRAGQLRGAAVLIPPLPQ